MFYIRLTTLQKRIYIYREKYSLKIGQEMTVCYCEYRFRGMIRIPDVIKNEMSEIYWLLD